jgi:xanthine phosphoribosyltransferase
MTDTTPSECFLSWDDIQTDARALSRLLLDRPSPDAANMPGKEPGKAPWKGIVAITRGGLVPATLIARELAIRVVDTLSIASYDELTQGDIHVLKTPEQAVADRGAGWLLIDDLVDTGATAKAARGLLPQALFAVLYAKPLGRGLADVHLRDFEQETWLHFPWDTEQREGRLAYAPPLAREAAP